MPVHRHKKDTTPTPMLATCGIRQPELACEYTSYCFLLLADSQEAEYNGKH
jgi:hypothetical protein